MAIFRLFTRLQSIVCGFDGAQRFPHNRLTLLRSVLVDLSDTHVVVWVKYVASVNEIVAAPDLGRRVFAYYGRLDVNLRTRVLDEWKREGGILVLTLSIGSYGLDLTEASTAIFYSNGFKYSDRNQAQSRLHRNGQTRTVTYIDLWADCGIEEKIADALAVKANVLERFRARIEEVKDQPIEMTQRLIRDL